MRPYRGFPESRRKGALRVMLASIALTIIALVGELAGAGAHSVAIGNASAGAASIGLIGGVTAFVVSRRE